MGRPNPKATRPDQGWWRPLQSRTWHYFGKDGRSLCAKWMHMGAELETGNDDSPENCATCRKKRLSSPEYKALIAAEAT